MKKEKAKPKQQWRKDKWGRSQPAKPKKQPRQSSSPILSRQDVEGIVRSAWADVMVVNFLKFLNLALDEIERERPAPKKRNRRAPETQ